MSVLSITPVYGLIEGSVRAGFESIWDYTSVFLSDIIVTKHKDWRAKCLTIIWLLVNTLMLFIFSGQLYTFLMRRPIIDKIEVMSDLFAKQYWKDSDIYLFDQEFSDFIVWGYLENNPIARQFIGRGDFLDPIDLYFNSNTLKSTMEKIIRDNAVIPAQKLLVYYLLRRAQNEFPELFEYLEEGIYYCVSKPEGDAQSYFLAVYKKRFNGTDLQILNKA